MAQKKVNAKRKTEISTMDKMQEVYERSMLLHCHYELVGENALGKILTSIRDNGDIKYNLKYPLFFFDKTIQ